MKACCLNENTPQYQKYGAKGILIAQEWVKDFPRFLEDMGAMPSNCNGLTLIDETKDFCKVNCQWVFTKNGRKKLEKRDVNVQKKRRGMKNPVSICLVLERDLLDFIKKQALHRSVNDGVLMEANQLIREAIVKAFPTPKQYNMFGEKKK